MPLRDLDYQARVLVRFDEYLTELAAQKAKADKIVAANAGEQDPDLVRPVPDFRLVPKLCVGTASYRKLCFSGP